MKLTKKQKEVLKHIANSDEPVFLSFNTRVLTNLLEKGLVETYRIQVTSVPVYSVTCFRLTHLGKRYMKGLI